MPGTIIFLDKPTDYQFMSGTLGIFKDQQHFIQIIQTPTRQPDGWRTIMQHNIDEHIRKGDLPEVFYRKEFSFGADSALFFNGLDNKPGLEQLVLMFVDDSVTAIVSADIPAGDTQARAAMLKVLLSAHIGHHAKMDPSAFATYTLRLGNSRFYYWGSSGQIFYYGIRGGPDPSKDDAGDKIMVIPIPGLRSRDELNEFIETTMEKTRQLGLEVPTYVKHDTLMNGYSASEVNFLTTYKGRKMWVYSLFVSTPGSGAMLMVQVGAGESTLQEESMKIAHSLRLK